MNDLIKLRMMQLLLHAAAIIGIIETIQTDNLHWFWMSLFFYLFWGFFGSTVGYHRLLAHKSFETYRPIYYFLTFCGMMHVNGSPLTAVLIHRSHHKYSDTKRDLHSPVAHGILAAYFPEWFGKKVKINLSLAREELKDPFFKRVHETYSGVIMLIFLILLYTDPLFLFHVMAIPFAMLYHVRGLFNVVPHKWGYRNHGTSDNSRNSWLINILTLGDGWHNNHHADPSKWNTKEKWWEIDPAAWFIKLIKKD